ncbi:hypothetical protein [Ralstonia soli]|uniref:Uncharacterized protein n=1 Tax=Ralstonia soli TaxID=2953896 RepID=A0ABT1AE35_9RALS|nr:hypothetical protein [Ralstonia soli]MCO5396588.1 hypothetical protein [Ralstonia soli]
MCTYSNVADLAARMRIEPETLLERLRAAGVEKANAQDPVHEADVAALSALYRKLLGSRAVEIADELQAEEEQAIQMPVTEVEVGLRRGMLSLEHNLLLVPLGNIRTSHQRRVLAILGGVEADGVVAVKVVSGSISEGYVQSLRHNGEHFRRVIALARRRIARVARDIVACLLSDREVAVHPAFAPPRAVI